MVRWARQLTESAPFRGFILSVILLAGVLVGLETSPAIRARHGTLLQAIDQAVLAVFVVEILLKLVAHGRRPWEFFRDGWNTFDGIVVALCLLPAAGPFAAVLRLARVLRLLRLVSALPKLQLLVGALFKSLSAMGYVSLLLALLFYVYAVGGVHLFGRAVPDEFGTLPAALLTLFRVVTLDNWGDSFNRAIEHVSGIKVTIFFVTFIVFGTMIILNLFIGIIMNSMSEAHAEQERRVARTGSSDPDLLARLDLAARHLTELQSVVAGLRHELNSTHPHPHPHPRAISGDRSEGPHHPPA